MKQTKNGNIKMSEKKFKKVIAKTTAHVYKLTMENQMKELAKKLVALDDNATNVEMIEVVIRTTFSDAS